MASHVWGTRTLLFTLEVLPSLKAQWSLEKGREQGWGSILGFVVSFWFCLTPNIVKNLWSALFINTLPKVEPEKPRTCSLCGLSFLASRQESSGWRTALVHLQEVTAVAACFPPRPPPLLPLSPFPHWLVWITVPVVAVQSCFWSLLAWRHCNVANNNNTSMIMHWLP